MPEGDSVFRVTQRLQRALSGLTITESDLRVPQEATRDFRGETVREVDCYGKHILMRIGEQTLHSHLRMDGDWQIYPAGSRWRKAAFRARAVIRTQNVDAVGFDIADISVVPTRDEHTVIGHLGPDPLKPDADLSLASAGLAADGRRIHTALLDQRNIAGLGTILCAEVLFLAGISPHRTSAECDTGHIVDLAQRALRASVAGGHRVFTGNPRQPYWVYGRAGRSCTQCGSTIKTAQIGADASRERVAYWCPRCQPE